MLVGNGLSIGFNPQLRLAEITAEMLRRIENDDEGGPDAVAAMRAVAERALPNGVTSDRDFEILVGAFGSESRALEDLRQLARHVRPQSRKLRRAIPRVARFANDVRDTGISHVLEVIFERSYADQQQSENIQRFARGIIEAFEGKVVLGNLNYDTLLLSALIHVCEGDLADMGHGQRRATVTTGGRQYEVPALRRDAGEFPSSRRVQLLHLHGSLTFWTQRRRNIFVKLRTEHLRDHDYFRRVRRRQTPVRPAVVLANQNDKAEHVEEFPFSLGYEMFSRGLDQATKWLVVGYSFRDAVVNDALRRSFESSDDVPEVLVVTLGSDPMLETVENAFGWTREHGSSSRWLTINRDGVDEMLGSAAWNAFAR